jgi:hypothetical protein
MNGGFILNDPGYIVCVQRCHSVVMSRNLTLWCQRRDDITGVKAACVWVAMWIPLMEGGSISPKWYWVSLLFSYQADTPLPMHHVHWLLQDPFYSQLPALGVQPVPRSYITRGCALRPFGSLTLYPTWHFSPRNPPLSTTLLANTHSLTSPNLP